MVGTPKKPDVIKDVGRPSKFTPLRCAAIVDAVSHRIPYELAAEANGICEDTLYEWLKIGRRHHAEGVDSDYTKFSEDLKKAEMIRVRQHNDIIAERPERWQADAWLLERRWHKYYSSNASLTELNHRVGKIEHGESKNESSRKEENGEQA